MAFVDQEFYESSFKGVHVPQYEFARLADDASEIIKSISQREISQADADGDDIKRAACYQIEYLYEAGGSQGVANAMLDGAITSERLGDFSVTRNKENQAGTFSVGGFPVSPMTVAILRRLGYLNRWLYAKVGGASGK